MRFITKKIETNPLNRMKNDQSQSETQIINNRNRIGNYLLHGVKKLMVKVGNKFELIDELKLKLQLNHNCFFNFSIQIIE